MTVVDFFQNILNVLSYDMLEKFCLVSWNPNGNEAFHAVQR